MVWVFDVGDGGLIVEERDCLDTAALMGQLGLDWPDTAALMRQLGLDCPPQPLPC
jgi:hypothetical protein